MQKIICFLLIVLLFLACADKEITNTNNDGGGGEDTQSFYRIEIEPSLSYDRSTILMVRADTSSTTLNGIYSARVRNPYRNPELLGDNITSPTLALSGNMIGFLQNSKLFLYDVISDSIFQVPTDLGFSELLFIKDSLLLVSYQSILSVYDLTTKNLSRLTSGLMPTSYNSDTIAYIKPIAINMYVIDLITILDGEIILNDNEIYIDTLNVLPISFGIEPAFRRYCYSVHESGKYNIYAGGVGIDSVWQVAESKYSDVVMLDKNTIIFTGVDGRLYRTDFFGKSSYPFWAG